MLRPGVLALLVAGLVTAAGAQIVARALSGGQRPVIADRRDLVGVDCERVRRG